MLVEHVVRPREAGLHGAQRDLQGLCDFLVGLVLDVAQHGDRAQLGAQAGDRALDLALELVARGRVDRHLELLVARIKARLAAGARLLQRVERSQVSCARTTLQVDRGVDRDAVHPARELALEAELAELAEQDPEGLLGGVERVGGIAGDPVADVVDPVLVELVELPERPIQPGQRGALAGLNQFRIGIGAHGRCLSGDHSTNGADSRFPVSAFRPLGGTLEQEIAS